MAALAKLYNKFQSLAVSMLPRNDRWKAHGEQYEAAGSRSRLFPGIG
jgi:hypothetical protein